MARYEPAAGLDVGALVLVAILLAAGFIRKLGAGRATSYAKTAP